ncbi:cupin domain-containing protein [Halosegnis marinus]|uniref:Cupin domain-containing protein n=1 Tax=Halosegnis marinus TaxID=3034023 RepID=A0ABD5ZMF7_9EURY|nr:cupin domain-containing protein [Halosegnis sp. DT85]
MEKVTVEDLDAEGMSDADVRRLAGPLGTSDVAINHYTLAPGERFSGGLHTHLDQEEVFYVLSGEATFERPDDEVTVGAGEAVRFAPGDFQSGYNGGDEPVVALALGAPKASEDVRVKQDCPECDSDEMRFVPAEDGFTLVCPECGTELDA